MMNIGEHHWVGEKANHLRSQERTLDPVALMSGAYAQSLLGDPEQVALEAWEDALVGPARRFLGNSGKGFRKELVHLGWELAWSLKLGDHAPATLGALRTQVPPCPPELAALLEVVHAGSLIIDDIEDDSETRRGQPCLHHQVGLPLALNVGNWLYFVAGSMIDRLNCGAPIKARMHARFNRVMLACHQGQALDLSCRVSELPREEIATLTALSTRLKTGVLVGFAVQLSALAIGMSEEESEPLYLFGERLGLGLQRFDDLSGLLNPARWHKGQEDLSRQRLTWVWVALAENQCLSNEDFDSFRALLPDPDLLLSSNESTVLSRLDEFRSRCQLMLQKAPQQTSEMLDESLAELHRAAPSGLAASLASRVIQRLCQSYL